MLGRMAFVAVPLGLKKPEKEKFVVRRFAGPAVYERSLDCVRVVHLTDMHVGRVTPMEAQFAAIELANHAKPDVVVITGDFVCHSQKFLDALRAVISGLQAPTYCVLGNHDHWSGADEVRDSLRRAGAEVLNNAVSTLTIRGQKLQILGLDDAYTGHADRAAAVKMLDRSVPTLGLSHIGEEADGLWHEGVPLVLSGHTHAGQITVARLHEIAVGKVAGHKYVHGLYGTRTSTEPSTGAVYVGAGVGAAVMPLRLGARAKREVTVFELGANARSDEADHSEQAPLPGRKPTDDLVARRHQRVLALKAKRESAK